MVALSVKAASVVIEEAEAVADERPWLTSIEFNADHRLNVYGAKDGFMYVNYQYDATGRLNIRHLSRTQAVEMVSQSS